MVGGVRTTKPTPVHLPQGQKLLAHWRSPEFRPTSAQISLRSFVPTTPKFRPYFIEMRSTTQRGNFMCNRQGEDMRATFLHTYLLTVHLYLLTYPIGGGSSVRDERP